MLTRNFKKLQAEVQRHVEADQVAQGSDKTGVIGCLAGGVDNPAYIEREYGIPKAVSRLAQSIFAGLPWREAASFFAALPDAIETDGKDLSRVGPQFLAAELHSLPTVFAETQALIAPVIAGMDLLAEGKGWPAHEASEADFRWAAATAALAAAKTAGTVMTFASAAYYAAAEATDAYDADDAAATYSDADIIVPRRRQRDTLLKLISEAPITTQENN